MYSQTCVVCCCKLINSKYYVSIFYLTRKQFNRSISNASQLICTCAQRDEWSLLYTHHVMGQSELSHMTCIKHNNSVGHGCFLKHSMAMKNVKHKRITKNLRLVPKGTIIKTSLGYGRGEMYYCPTMCKVMIMMNHNYTRSLK